MSKHNKNRRPRDSIALSSTREPSSSLPTPRLASDYSTADIEVAARRRSKALGSAGMAAEAVCKRGESKARRGALLTRKADHRR